jgi:hypothetical protein
MPGRKEHRPAANPPRTAWVGRTEASRIGGKLVAEWGEAVKPAMEQMEQKEKEEQ